MKIETLMFVFVEDVEEQFTMRSRFLNRNRQLCSGVSTLQVEIITERSSIKNITSKVIRVIKFSFDMRVHLDPQLFKAPWRSTSQNLPPQPSTWFDRFSFTDGTSLRAIHTQRYYTGHGSIGNSIRISDLTRRSQKRGGGAQTSC